MKEDGAETFRRPNISIAYDRSHMMVGIALNRFIFTECIEVFLPAVSSLIQLES